MAVADKVKSIIVEQLGVDEEEVTPDASFVDACVRATRGTPFLLRVLVDALAEGCIAPTAENSQRKIDLRWSHDLHYLQFALSFRAKSRNLLYWSQD